MIELRWIAKDEKQPAILVLQYRTWNPRMDASGALNVMGIAQNDFCMPIRLTPTDTRS
jgi:hypothetical protein